MKVTRAMILAAGLGTRMRPLTNTMPKPLIPVRGKPLIDWCIDWLKDAGITQVVINSSYLAEQLEAHVRGANVTISREDGEPLETGGGVLKALPLLGSEPFLTMNSDAIFPKQFTHPVLRLCDAWEDGIDFVMLLVKKSQAIGWEGGKGDFVLAEDGRIRRPRAGEDAPYIFTGVELIHPRVFEGVEPGKFSLGVLWKQHVDAEGWYKRIRAVAHEGVWVNVGDLAGLTDAEAYFATSAGN